MAGRDLARDVAFEAWVARGRSVRVIEELTRRGHYPRLKRAGRELVGPCPLCGGRDRFGVNPAKDIWNCRGCAAGGDAIALVCNVDGVDFLRAVEILAGEPPPGAVAGESAQDRAARETRLAAAVAAARAADARKAIEQDQYRERERARMYREWTRAQPVAGSAVEAYLGLRGVQAPAEAALRFLPAYTLWSGPAPDGRIVHRGPAMAAAIVGPDGRFAGMHVTWIDLADPDGKARVADPETGELVPAKKVRGSKKGGSVLLGRPPRWEARTLFLGEGIETVLSVRAALLAAAAPVFAEAEWRSSVDLGNLAGRAAGRVAHPTATKLDRRGRVRRLQVADATPHAEDHTAVLAIGGAIERVILLGDGDSDPFATGLALQRAAARLSLAYPWITVGLSMAPAGQDFNDLWRGMIADGLAREGAPGCEGAPTVPAQGATALEGAL